MPHNDFSNGGHAFVHFNILFKPVAEILCIVMTIFKPRLININKTWLTLSCMTVRPVEKSEIRMNHSHQTLYVSNFSSDIG